MKRLLAIAATTVLMAGGAAWAQSTATPDTGSVLNGISTGMGAGAGQGVGGVTRQDEGAPANTSRPARGTGGMTATQPPTGVNPVPVMPDMHPNSKKQAPATPQATDAAGKQGASNRAKPGQWNPPEPRGSGGVSY